MSTQSKGRPAGVLPINAAATKKTSNAQKSSQRTPAPRLRLIIRRLPPGLTETEFWDALGAEWQSGNGKADYHAFKEGKISKDPSKPSRPGRAYIRVKDQSLLEVLSAKVKATPFKDAKNTGNDSCLVGPPSLEFAPYNKVPSGRNRHDGRQGTIDQDQEFIDFLQSLTQPITRSTVNGSDANDAKQEKVVITPLVQFIKEKKANKAKEKEAAAAAKSSKKNQDSKEVKTKGDSRTAVAAKNNAATVEKVRIVKATQEVVKVANKSAAKAQSKVAATKAESKAIKETPAAAIATAAPAPKPERARGNATAASRMIARDLGLAPKEPRTQRAAKNVNNLVSATTESTQKTETQSKLASASSASTAKPVSSNPPAQNSTPPTGPKSSRVNATPPAKPAAQTLQNPAKSIPQPSAGAKSAFLKHANPSQGVTEELLRAVFVAFGEVTRCEIDKKKGLGYIDFDEAESLKKAMAASPVKVGNGQVVVLENKSPYKKQQAQSSSGAQGSNKTAKSNSRAPSVASSAVPSAVTSPQPKQAAIASAALAVTATTVPAANIVAEKNIPPESATGTESPSLTAISGAPTAPKAARIGGAPGRNARGGTAAPANRGGGNQTATRGRGRGGRGARGGRAANGTAAPAGSTSATVSSPLAESPAGNATVKPVSTDKAT